VVQQLEMPDKYLTKQWVRLEPEQCCTSAWKRNCVGLLQ